jgi:hypothetical protein
MQSYLPLTPESVRDVAMGLMAAHGATTTLEVKNQLRNRGYWALQRDVSRLMRVLADAEGWIILSTGRFRVYLPPGCPCAAAPLDFALILN